MPDELERYENNLYDNWDRMFSIVVDKIEGAENPQEIIQAGKNFYNEFIEKNHPNIRPNYSSVYYPIGSYHMLAEKKRIGWHPNYENLIDDVI